MAAPPPRDFPDWMRMVERELARARATNNVRLLNRIEKAIGETGTDLTRIPAAPIEMVFQTSLHTNVLGMYFGRVVVDFPDVVVGQDAQPIEVSYYELWGRDESEYDPQGLEDPPPWQRLTISEQSVLVYDPLEPGSTWRFRLRAIGMTTVTPGAWSAERVVTVQADTVPPPIPSTPILTTRNSVFDLEWDGLAASGDPMPADFSYVEVALGTTTSPTTLANKRMPYAGSVQFPGLPYNTIHYFRIRAVDTSGNKSNWSANVSDFTEPNVDVDEINREIDRRVRRGDNLIPNGDASAETNEGFESWSLDFVDKPVGATASFVSLPEVSTNDTGFGTLTVTPDRGYVFSVWIKADSPGSTMQIEVIPVDGIAGTDPQFVFDGVVPTEWTKLDVPVTIGGDVTGVFFRVHHNVGGTTVVQRTADWVFQSKVSGVIIEDDSIVAGQIFVDDTLWARIAEVAEVNAGHIDFNTFEGDSGFIGALNSSVITGAYYQTSETYPKVVLDEFGLRSYNSSGLQRFRVDAASGDVAAAGGIFTGSTFRTSATSPRVEFSQTGLRAYNSSGTNTFDLSSSTGNVTATGTFISNASNGTYIRMSGNTWGGNPGLMFGVGGSGDPAGIYVTSNGTMVAHSDRSSTGSNSFLELEEGRARLSGRATSDGSEIVLRNSDVRLDGRMGGATVNTAISQGDLAGSGDLIPGARMTWNVSYLGPVPAGTKRIVVSPANSSGAAALTAKTGSETASGATVVLHNVDHSLYVTNPRVNFILIRT